MSQPDDSARSYNHLHTPRKYSAGKRRFSVYWTWSYPWEANRDTTEMDNRFSTMTEVRRVAWPAYETQEYSERMFLQGIAGTLELFHLSIVRFQEVVGAVTGSPSQFFSASIRQARDCRWTSAFSATPTP